MTLVACHAGKTGPKCKKTLDDARGGILFIDEAHQLIRGREDQYGYEAIGVINKYSEDHRDDICIVLAGYPDEMATLLRADPGLPSRFTTRFDFDPYSADELMRIAPQLAERECHGATLDDSALAELRPACERIAADPKHGGNARELRNVLWLAVERRNARLVRQQSKALAERDDEELYHLTIHDVVSPEEKAERQVLVEIEANPISHILDNAERFRGELGLAYAQPLQRSAGSSNAVFAHACAGKMSIATRVNSKGGALQAVRNNPIAFEFLNDFLRDDLDVATVRGTSSNHTARVDSL